MKYAIIATLGPASDRPAIWQALLAAGASAFRLNTSHLTLAGLEDWLEELEPFAAALASPLDVVLDLQGSKWRLGRFTPFELVPGQRVELIEGEAVERAGTLPVPHADFFRAAALSNGEIVLNDAKSRLRIEAAGEGRIAARVVQGGRIAPHKGITFVDCAYRQEALSAKDQAVVARTRGLPWVRYAISYVKDAAEMVRYRQWMGPEARLIAKLERGPAMQAVPGIAQACDELWVCRGDLGAEIGLAAMARAVADVGAQVGALSKPVLMAGQVLEHMTASPTPTRSEVCYLWDALQKGYRGFVLSDETAIGANPVESVRTAALFRAGE